MTNTVFVRYPDKTKDDPDGPGTPNEPKVISVGALPAYRARGYVQCEADGSPVAKAMPNADADAGGAPKKLAGAADDEHADRADELAEQQEKLLAEQAKAAKAATPAVSGSTGKGDA